MDDHQMAIYFNMFLCPLAYTLTYEGDSVVTDITFVQKTQQYVLQIYNQCLLGCPTSVARTYILGHTPVSLMLTVSIL